MGCCASKHAEKSVTPGEDAVKKSQTGDALQEPDVQAFDASCVPEILAVVALDSASAGPECEGNVSKTADHGGCVVERCVSARLLVPTNMVCVLTAVYWPNL